MELTPTINYFKNQLNPVTIENVIDTIDNIEYLSLLNFQDLKNLCQSIKKFNVCTNALFRKIIYRKINVLIPENIPIYDIINNINNQIIHLIHEHYDENIPRYVNRSLFYQDMLVDSWEALLTDLMEFIVENIDEKGRVDKYLYKSDFYLSNNLAFPFRSNYDDTPSYDFKIDNLKFKIPNHFWKYLLLSLGSMKGDYDYWGKFRILKKALFI